MKFLELNSTLLSYLFFIIILPFINGFVDFVSFGISRLLGQKILKDRTFKAFLWHFVIDFVAAVILLVILVFGICFSVELFNNLVVKKPDLMINLPQLIDGARKAPLGPEGLWVTFMLFSTLVPTFAHFVIAFLGVYTIYLTPKKWRQKLADILEESGSKRSLILPVSVEESGSKRSRILPVFYFASRSLVCIMSVFVFWGLFVYVVNTNILHFAGLLSNVAYWGIELASNVST